jgi:hypothetical protein
MGDLEIQSAAELAGALGQIIAGYDRPCERGEAVQSSRCRTCGPGLLQPANAGFAMTPHGESPYTSVQAAFAWDDFTAASMKRTPRTPSATIGTRLANSLGSRPSMRAVISSAMSA